MPTAFPLLLALAAPSPEPKELKAPVLKLVSATLHDGNAALTFEVHNPNAAPLPYVGYTSKSFEGGLKEGTIAPIYRVELDAGDGWKKHEPGWCGTGIGPVAIPAKGKGTFQAHVPAGSWEKVRVGLTWSKSDDRKAGSDVAFSAPVSRAAMTATPKK